jgi:hypothetical protein
MSRIRIMVAVCAADNALIESPTLTAEHLSSLHWIVSYDATTQYTPADKHLRFAGVKRQVEEAAWWPVMRVGRLIPVSRSVAVGALGHRIGARADSAGSTSRVGVARELTPR